MTDDLKTNLVYRLKQAILKKINSERRDNVIMPAPTEMWECLMLAVEELQPTVMKPRKPGRPKKPKTKVVDEAEFVPLPSELISQKTEVSEEEE